MVNVIRGLRLKCTESGIKYCARMLKRGGIGVFPTDTVYGIGCDPYNQDAVGRIFRLKRRDENNPLPVLVRDTRAAEKLVDLGNKGRLLAGKFWPGPLTIVAPLIDHSMSPKVTATTEKLGVRVPNNECALSLLRQCEVLVGTSANLTGFAPPRSADEVLESGLEGFDVLLDGGKVTGKESTIVDITTFAIIREAAIDTQEILGAIGGEKS